MFIRVSILFPVGESSIGRRLILMLRGIIFMCIGNFAETLSQQILEGIILVGRLGVQQGSEYLMRIFMGPLLGALS